LPVSPRISARARERYKVAAVKDDRFDAFVLADTLRHEHAHWRVLPVPSPLLAEIRALTRDRDRLLATHQAVEHQLRMILEAFHPAPVRLFSSVDRQITLSFVLDYPTPAVASQLKTTRMSGFLSRHHYTGRVPAQVLAERMRATPSLALAPITSKLTERGMLRPSFVPRAGRFACWEPRNRLSLSEQIVGTRRQWTAMLGDVSPGPPLSAEAPGGE
jgi:hypothetical protein